MRLKRTAAFDVGKFTKVGHGEGCVHYGTFKWRGSG